MSKNSLLNAFQNFIRERRLIEDGDKILVAVSGGVDSMALLDLLDNSQKELHFTLAVIHFNHQLRGNESDGDEHFVRTIAEQRHLQYFAERADTSLIAEAKKQSLQEVARDLRYAFFESMKTAHGFQKIATAHHADDNAETVLFNFLRGSGVSGLSGIPVRRNDLNVIRPLLFSTREEISDYAKAHSLAYREDSSNQKNTYTRNFLRNELIPSIREHINQNVSASLNRTCELFSELQIYLTEEAERILPEIVIEHSPERIILDLPAFQSRRLFLQEYLLLKLARQFTSREIEFSTVRAMLNVIKTETGTLCSIARNAVVYRDRNRFVFARTPVDAPFCYQVESNCAYDFEQFSFHTALVSAAPLSKNPNVEFADANAIGHAFIVRAWNDGDWFIPLGMHEKKKLSDFFIDEKVPLFEKHTIPLVVSNNNIVWVCGQRLDNRYKITPQTKTILKLEYTPRHHTS